MMPMIIAVTGEDIALPLGDLDGGEPGDRAGQQPHEGRPLLLPPAHRELLVTAAKEAATSVLMNATAVTDSTRNSLPALKPYHPNQSSPVPSPTRGTLWGPASILDPAAGRHRGSEARAAMAEAVL